MDKKWLKSDLKEWRSEIEKEEREEQQSQSIVCGNCKKNNIINETTLYQTRYYVEPYGCAGGGYCVDAECQIICCHCGQANRLLFNDKKIEKKFERFKNLFPVIIQTYKDQNPYNPSSMREWENIYMDDFTNNLIRIGK